MPWIQYNTVDGSNTGWNSSQVSDDDLAKLGKAQIFYDGDPSGMMVDITQNPPAIIPYTAPIDYTSQAQRALAASDKTVLRCVENGVAVPAAWVTYRQALRAIADGTQQGPLPAKPGYPPGT